MRLEGSILKVSDLNRLDIEQMFKLMDLHYLNVKFDRFSEELGEKDRVIVLRDRENKIQGFTTIKTIAFNVDGVIVKGLFSGDTIIHRDFWGSLELPRIWTRFAFSLAGPEKSGLYWFLISKGYKTYRFLPVYFHSFYPCHNRETPHFEKKLIDFFGHMKYQGQYNPDTGVICHNGSGDYLRPGIGHVTEKRLKDINVAFFLERNPGYYRGDELVCLAELSPANLKPAGCRFLVEDE